MAIPVILPKFNMDMEEGTLIRWLKNSGERVTQGEPLCEVETDKVNMEVEAPADGILCALSASPGDTIPVTSTIAYIAKDESEASLLESKVREPIASEVVAEKLPPQESQQLEQKPEKVDSTTVVKAVPAVRRLAKEQGIDLTEVAGPDGRVTMEMLMAVIEKRKVQAQQITKEVSSTKLAGTRKTIADRMSKAASIPHISLFIEINADTMLKALDQLRAKYGRSLSLFTLICYATVQTLQQHRLLNSTFDGESLASHDHVNLGIAVAREQGLIVPVVKQADLQDVKKLSESIANLVERARSNQLLLEEVQEGTFTVSNLGNVGVEYFTALVNPPQVGILSVGAVREQVVPVLGGYAVSRVFKVGINCDHRIVDGEPAAKFLKDLKSKIEDMSFWIM